MRLHPVKFYQASRHDKELVTTAGAPLRMAGFPVPPNTDDEMILTLVYDIEGDPEEKRVPVTFRVNRYPGKTLCTKEWPSNLPFPKCGDRKNGIPGEPVICEVIHFTEAPQGSAPHVESAVVEEADPRLAANYDVPPPMEGPGVEEEHGVAADL